MATGNIEQTWNNSSSGYCKMPDGTLIQWGSKDDTMSNNRSWGEFYIADLETVQFPISFYSTPKIFLTPSTTSSFFVITVVATTTEISTVQVGRGTAFQSGINYGYDWLAVGRWKA